MEKIYTALGLMSGTSMDGVDVSVINSDGNADYFGVFDQYFEYNKELYQKLINLRDKIINLEDLKINFKEIKLIEREITLFHAEVVNQIVKTSKINFDFIGFHGQTIYHNPTEKFTFQIGNSVQLANALKINVVSDMRTADIESGGQGAPLVPIYHYQCFKKFDIPLIVLNIGGVSNITCINYDDLIAFDTGPGNSIINDWVSYSLDIQFDEYGNLAKNDESELYYRFTSYVYPTTIFKYYYQ